MVPIDGNLFWTPGKAQPWGAHADEMDFIVYQIAGKKVWRVAATRQFVRGQRWGRRAEIIKRLQKRLVVDSSAPSSSGPSAWGSGAMWSVYENVLVALFTGNRPDRLLEKDYTIFELEPRDAMLTSFGIVHDVTSAEDGLTPSTHLTINIERHGFTFLSILAEGWSVHRQAARRGYSSPSSSCPSEQEIEQVIRRRKNNEVGESVVEFFDASVTEVQPFLNFLARKMENSNGGDGERVVGGTTHDRKEIHILLGRILAEYIQTLEDSKVVFFAHHFRQIMAGMRKVPWF